MVVQARMQMVKLMAQRHILHLYTALWAQVLHSSILPFQPQQ
jgi:hypothetical protein